MKEYNDYDLKYPGLILELIEYFDMSGNVNDKSVLKFCEQNPDRKENGALSLHPDIINKICKKLCEKGTMSTEKIDGGLGFHNNYLVVIKNRDILMTNRERLQIYYNSIVYGFEYIYHTYKEIVVPLVWEKENGDYSAGTGFELYGGIVTAKHCITDPKNLSIKGYSIEELKRSKIYISDNPNIDIAFIDVGRKNTPKVFTDNGRVLQDVLVLGYPKIPAFTHFLTAEKATVSSKAISRLTPTKGSIAAFGDNYLAGTELMLITAKIRGGNSGGPVINEEGSIVGISCQLPNYEGDVGDYDDLGYGVVVPIKYLNEIVSQKKESINVAKDFYKEFFE